MLWTVVLEKTLESPLDCKEIQPVHSKGDQSSVFIGRTDVEAETPILWPPDAKSWLIGKDPDAGKDWGQEEKGTTEDEMAGWHHWCDGREFGWTPGVGDGQGGLAYCGSWGCKELNTTERLNWTVCDMSVHKIKEVHVSFFPAADKHLVCISIEPWILIRRIISHQKRFFQRWLLQCFSCQILISGSHADTPPEWWGICPLSLNPGRNLCDGLDQQIQGSDATGLPRLRSWTYHTHPPHSLGRFHLGTQPPCCEEAQATRRGHCWCSSPQSDPPGRCLQTMLAPGLHIFPDKDQMTWNWDQLFPVPCLDSWRTGSLSTMYFSFQPLTYGMVYFSLTML